MEGDEDGDIEVMLEGEGASVVDAAVAEILLVSSVVGCESIVDSCEEAASAAALFCGFAALLFDATSSSAFFAAAPMTSSNAATAAALGSTRKPC